MPTPFPAILVILRATRRGAALLLGAGFVLVIEILLALVVPESTLIKEYRQVLHRAKAEPVPDLLVMGDSVARGSLLVGVLRDGLGRELSIRNDAMQGTGPEIAYFSLNRLIASGKIPRAILYAPSPHTFASTRMHIAAGGFCTWREVGDLLRSGHGRMDVLRHLPLRFSYTLRYREPIAELLKGRREVTGLFADPVLDEDAWVARLESHSAGAAARDFGREPLKPHFRMGFSVAPVNRHYLDRFVGLAACHGIRIYWAIPPCMQRGYDSREEYGFNADFRRFLGDLAQAPNVTVLQEDSPIYPDAVFLDQNHLDLVGSRRFSQEVAALLARVLGWTLVDSRLIAP